MTLVLSNFLNCYAQYRDITDIGSSLKILLVGVGTGFEPGVLRWAGHQVTTADLDSSLEPDYVLSIDDLTIFPDFAFDVVIASHVLEHLPWQRFDVCLAGLSRVAKRSLIYLPIAGGVWGGRIYSSAPRIDAGWSVNMSNPFRKVDGETPSLMGGQHYWEIGRPGFPLSKIKQAINQHFAVSRSYRNEHWPVSYNFVCESRYVLQGNGL